MDKQVIVFKGQFTRQSIETSTFNIINKQNVCLRASKWKSLNMSEVCKKIQEWNSNQISFQQAHNSMILKELSPISKFSELISISFKENNLQSIQSLHCLRFPKLINLFLMENHLTNIQVFAKVNYPHLSLFSLHHNKIIEGKVLNKMLFNIKEQLFCISLDLFDYSCCQCQDINWLAKCQMKKIQLFWLKSSGRIQQNITKGVFRKKYPAISA